MTKQNNKENKSLTGFTLIETMVTVVIFTLVMSLVVAVFTANVRNQRVAIYNQKLVSETVRVMNYMIEELSQGGNYVYEEQFQKLNFVNSEGGSENFQRHLYFPEDRWVLVQDGEHINSEIININYFYANTAKGSSGRDKVTFTIEAETKTGEREDDIKKIKLQTTVISRYYGE